LTMSVWSGVSEGKARAIPPAKSMATTIEAIKRIARFIMIPLY
jgi:hypothetical protein